MMWSTTVGGHDMLWCLPSTSSCFPRIVLASGTDGPLEDEQRESVDTIREAGAGLAQIIEEVVDGARLETGRLQVHEEPVALDRVAREACDRLLPHLRRRSVDVHLDVGRGAPLAAGDTERARQCLVSVMAAIVRRSVGDGAIRVEVRSDASFVVVTVTTKLALPQSAGDAIVRALASDAGGGSVHPDVGRGLLLACRLARAQGGDLRCDAYGADGARFTLTLGRASDELLARRVSSVPERPPSAADTPR